MAGSYPNAPSARIAYDEDGTIVWESESFLTGTFGGAGEITAMRTPPTEFSQATKQELNDEDTVVVRADGGPAAVDYGYGWVWPEKRDIYGVYLYAPRQGSGNASEVSLSTESRNGITGFFSTEAARDSVDTDGNTIPTLIQPPGSDWWSVQQSYREFIHPLSSTGTTSTRVRINTPKTAPTGTDPTRFCAAHWYGEISDGANPDRVLFMDADTGLEHLLQDWGDIPRGSIHDKDIYLLNNSATLSASSNVLTFEGLYEDSYTWYTIKDNGSTAPAFSTTVTVDGPLAPGARYPSTDTLTVRLTVDPDENLGPAAARLQLESQWS